MDAFQNLSLPPVSFRFLNQNFPGTQIADRIRNAVAGSVARKSVFFFIVEFNQNYLLDLVQEVKKWQGGD